MGNAQVNPGSDEEEDEVAKDVHTSQITNISFEI